MLRGNNCADDIIEKGFIHLPSLYETNMWRWSHLNNINRPGTKRTPRIIDKTAPCQVYRVRCVALIKRHHVRFTGWGLCNSIITVSLMILLWWGSNSRLAGIHRCQTRYPLRHTASISSHFSFRVRLTIMLVFLSILLGVLIVPKNSLLIYHWSIISPITTSWCVENG